MDTKHPAQQAYYYFVYFLHFSICVGGEGHGGQASAGGGEENVIM